MWSTTPTNLVVWTEGRSLLNEYGCHSILGRYNLFNEKEKRESLLVETAAWLANRDFHNNKPTSYIINQTEWKREKQKMATDEEQKEQMAVAFFLDGPTSSAAVQRAISSIISYPTFFYRKATWMSSTKHPLVTPTVFPPYKSSK